MFLYLTYSRQLLLVKGFQSWFLSFNVLFPNEGFKIEQAVAFWFKKKFMSSLYRSFRWSFKSCIEKYLSRALSHDAQKYPFFKGNWHRVFYTITFDYHYESTFVVHHQNFFNKSCPRRNKETSLDLGFRIWLLFDGHFRNLFKRWSLRSKLIRLSRYW